MLQNQILLGSRSLRDAFKKKKQKTSLMTLLSGEDIWINLLTQKRYTVHIDRCDIWIDLRAFLNFLVHLFSSKLRSKEAKVKK